GECERLCGIRTAQRFAIQPLELRFFHPHARRIGKARFGAQLSLVLATCRTRRTCKDRGKLTTEPAVDQAEKQPLSMQPRAGSAVGQILGGQPDDRRRSKVVIWYEYILEAHTVGSAALHAHHGIAAPIALHRQLVLRYDEYDGTCRAGIIRNDSAAQEVVANGNTGSERPESGDGVAPFPALELRHP